MKSRHLPVLTLVALVAVTAAATGAPAQDTSQAAEPDRRDNRPVLSTSSDRNPSSFRTAAEIRQARALYQSRQRIERLERNAWYGYQPLRPSFNAVPMTSAPRRQSRVLYFPVFLYAR